MVKLPDPNQSYTFSKIFDLKILADELANEFGHSYTRKSSNWLSIPGRSIAWMKPDRGSEKSCLMSI